MIEEGIELTSRFHSEQLIGDQAMSYELREMALDETKSMIRYFLNANVDFLIGMGVDKDKLPDEGKWFELMQRDFERPIEQRDFYYLVWMEDGVPFGHCNINKIEFGERAFMHLHIWNESFRRIGCATHLLKPSIRHFFDRFELKELFCEPYARNPAPNKALPKAGFQFVKTYDTTPGWIAYHQPVNRWMLVRKQVLAPLTSATSAGRMTNDSNRDGYIHGTSAEEQARLRALNRLTNPQFLKLLDVRPQMRVLEVGSGLGLLASEVAATNGVSVVGVERSRDQIDAAQPAQGVEYIQGDATKLDFPDASFDLTYSRFLLEHLSDPLSALREMRRVTRAEGRVVSCENDISLVRIDPPCPSFDTVWGKFQMLQRNLSGNAQIGTSLYRLCRNAGFRNVQLSVQPEVHWHGSKGFDTWIRNLMGNVLGAQQQLIGTGLCSHAMIAAAIEELETLTDTLDASSWFVWNRAVASDE